MKSLIFLLLLDYSGSMDQKLPTGAPKIDVLRTEMTALTSTVREEALGAALIFGSNPAKSCGDIREFMAPAKKVANEIAKLKPGAYGRTPLAATLRRGVQLASQYRVGTMIAVTDGGDTCGEDPCAALKVADKKLDGKLSGGNKKLRLEIVGFDLRNQSSQLACFKKLKLKNIEVSLTEAGSETDLQRQLKRASLGDVTELGPTTAADLAKIKGARRTKVGYKDSLKNEIEDPRKPPVTPQEDAILEIVGAPSHARFHAVPEGSAQDGRDWLGSYAVRLKPGPYALRFDDVNGADLKLTLPSGSFTRIPWARLMKVSESDAKIVSPVLGLKWVPALSTKDVHGELDKIESGADLGRADLMVSHVPFGEWDVEVSSPEWLVGFLPVKKLNVSLGSATEINLEQLYANQLKWVQNPHPDKEQVLKLVRAGGREERYLIPPGQKRLPIPHDAEAEFLSAP